MTEQTMHSYWITSSGREGSGGNVNAHFPYWSFTKTVISICALKLVEGRKLDLDIPLVDRNYTLRQLLAHTSGLPDYGHLEEYQSAVAKNKPPWSRERLLDLALDKGQLFEPGQGWSYSNIGYMFVRELIEEVMEKPLGRVISDMICKPLGLTSIELAETSKQFAQLHWDAAADYNPLWVYHGCLTGSASDAARLLHALFQDDLLRPDTFKQMRKARSLGGPIPDRPWTKCGYALGLMSGAVDGAGTAVGHSGCGPFSVNAVYHFPDAPDPITIACFADGKGEGVAEFAATKLAQDV